MVDILAPLVDISVRIEQPKPIGQQLSHRLRPVIGKRRILLVGPLQQISTMIGIRRGIALGIWVSGEPNHS